MAVRFLGLTTEMAPPADQDFHNSRPLQVLAVISPGVYEVGGLMVLPDSKLHLPNLVGTRRDTSSIFALILEGSQKTKTRIVG